MIRNKKDQLEKEELKYKEIGEIVGCTEGNARIKVHRALNELKTIFRTLENR